MTTATVLSRAEIEAQPSLLFDLLLKLRDVRIRIEPSDDQISIYPQRRYPDEVYEILRESEELYQKRKAEGYTREQAFENIRKFQREVSALMAKQENE